MGPEFSKVHKRKLGREEAKRKGGVILHVCTWNSVVQADL